MPEYAYTMFPQTMRIIDKYPKVKLAMFSRLDAGGMIPKHTGISRDSIRVHLALMTPNSDDCSITVDGTKRTWRDGELIVFDDTYEHSVENQSDHMRVILFLNVSRRVKSGVAQLIHRLNSRWVWRWTGRRNEELVDRASSATRAPE